ncbi:TPA: PD-(D/E)XK nuclease family protein [Campylobacter coli]
MSNLLGYVDKSKDIPEGYYLFSASSINNYFFNPNKFFRKVILKEEVSEQTNSTILGTIVHHFASNYDRNYDEVEKEVIEFLEEYKSSESVDINYIKSKYPFMAQELISYIKNFDIFEPTERESSYLLKLTDRVYLGGTIDVRYDNLLLDYKTTSNKYITTDTPIPDNYKLQLYTYLHLLHKNNVKIDKYGITWISVPEYGRISEKTGKPLKDYSTNIVTNTEYIDLDFYNEVWKKIMLVAENIEYILGNPNSLYLFAKDLELKGK